MARRLSITLEDSDYALLARVAEADTRSPAAQVRHYIRTRVAADAHRLWPREYPGRYDNPRPRRDDP